MSRVLKLEQAVKTRRPNPRLVKIHRSYTVDEVACLFGKHKNTVRAWLKEGLPACDTKRPTLILGAALRAFLEVKRTKHKKPCGAGEIYCVRCREPRKPAGQMAEYRPLTDTSGNLIGICPECDCMMFRRTNRAKVALIEGELEVTFAKAQEHIVKSTRPSVNSDFNQGAQIHEIAQP